jgi:potassium-transporting ATPase potassium-binding subunit
MPWDVSFNTAVSFVTNTSWQFYAEASLSFFSQMAVISLQSFLSAAVGVAVGIAVIRGFVRRGGGAGLGNFWGDLVRGYTGFVQPNAPGNAGAYGITFANILGSLAMLAGPSGR